MLASIRRIIGGFRGDPQIPAKRLRDLYETDQSGFVEASRQILRENLEAPGLPYILTLLLNNGVIVKWLTDPDHFTTAQATTIVEILRRTDPRIDVLLIAAAFPPAGGGASDKALGEAACLRVLEITRVANNSLRFLPVVAQLLRHSSAKVRTKAALIVGRGNKNPKWVFGQLADADARLRANAIESLWDTDDQAARAVFQSALGDPNNRVVGNAALGLYKIGDPSSISLLLQMISNPDERYRETGIWTMEQTGDGRFRGALAKLMTEHPEHRAKILRALNALKRGSEAKSKNPPIRIVVDRFEHDPKTQAIELKLAALTKLGPVSGLLATQFAIWQDGVLVDDYEMENVAAKDPAATALIVPRSMGRDMQEHLVLALRGAVRFRRSGDAWCVVKYRNADQAAFVSPSGTFAHKTRTLGLELEEEPVMSPAAPSVSQDDGDLLLKGVHFSENEDMVEDMLLNMGTHETSAASLASAVLSGIAAMPAVNPIRAVLLMLDEVSSHEPLHSLEKIVRTAQFNKAAIHVIASEPSEFGSRLAAETGGQYFAPCAADRYNEIFESFNAVITGGYRLRFTGTGTQPSTLRLQIHTDSAIGDIVYRPASR